MQHILPESRSEPIEDSLHGHWTYSILPLWLLPYAQLARWDRPIGWHLLFWPCAWSSALSFIAAQKSDEFLYPLSAFGKDIILFLIGSILMRGAGCAYNDIIDQRIDNQVLRTRLRPLPSGGLTRFQALIFLVIQLCGGFIILLQFNPFTIFLGIISLPIVFFYPFVKKISNWPQLFIGLCFSWGALMGWAAIFQNIDVASLLLYCGSVVWVMGYDTIYAHQDTEDDAFLGMGSTALLFGEKTNIWLYGFYGFAFLCFLSSLIVVKAPLISFFGLFAATVHMARQIYSLDIHNRAQCLQIFRSNSLVGLFIFTGLLLGGLYICFANSFS